MSAPTPAVAPETETAFRRTTASPLRRRVRGTVLILLCTVYAISYIDRVNISTAAPAIRDSLDLSATQFGAAMSAFSLPYAFLQIFGGWIGDRFGPRRVLFAVGIACGVATVATGFATGLLTLLAARLGLGIGEGAAFPTATHAMARWVPPDRRGFCQGVVHSASRLGNAAAPLLVAALIGAWNWRVSFWLMGTFSVVWAAIWLRFFRDRPDAHDRVTDEELAELRTTTTVAAGEARHSPAVPWRRLIPRILPVTLVDFCYGWGLWVFLTWLPSFFSDRYGLPLKTFALFTSLVLAAGVVGDTLGGLLSDHVLRRTGRLSTARRINIVVGLTGSLLWLIPILIGHSLTLITVSLALSFFFLELTNSVLWAIPMDIAPEHAGAASGMMNTGFGLAGVISPLVFGLLYDRSGTWTVPFGLTVVLLGAGILVATRIRFTPLAGADV